MVSNLGNDSMCQKRVMDGLNYLGLVKGTSGKEFWSAKGPRSEDDVCHPAVGTMCSGLCMTRAGLDEYCLGMDYTLTFGDPSSNK
ncbi:hypothetical protein U1Q18_041657 [Sarracenia purpurea var. burkii]